MARVRRADAGNRPTGRAELAAAGRGCRTVCRAGGWAEMANESREIAPATAAPKRDWKGSFCRVHRDFMQQSCGITGDFCRRELCGPRSVYNWTDKDTPG